MAEQEWFTVVLQQYFVDPFARAEGGITAGRLRFLKIFLSAFSRVKGVLGISVGRTRWDEKTR